MIKTIILTLITGIILIEFDLGVVDIFLEPICDFLCQKQGFCLSTAFGVSNDGFRVLNIHEGEFRASPIRMPPADDKFSINI